MDTNKKPMIQFNSFQFHYFSQAEPTLHDINLTIYEGEKVLIVGPSGSGKSTLGNCLNGLIPFAYKGEIEGSLKINGRETREMNIFELSKMVGTVLQDADGQFIGLTVGEDIAFALENDCVDQGTMKETVQRVADMVDMGKLLKSSPFELSGGQKQRVSFAGVMVDDVDILLFDEPLANLDPATGKTAIDLIDHVWKELGKTVVIIEHRLEDVLYRDVDRIVVVNDGRIAADMTPDELIAADILPGMGIREPLYATALKYAGVSVTPEMRPGRMETLRIEMVKEAVQKWALSRVPDREVNDRPDILTAEHVSFQYTKKRRILKDLSFHIREGEMVSIKFDDNNAYINCVNFEMVCRLIEGRYPNYNSVIPQENPFKVTIDRISFLNALKRVSVFSNPASSLVKLQLKENEMLVSAQDIDFSTSAEEKIVCSFDGTELSIGFKATYLIEILSNINSEEVILELADPSRAGLIVPSENEENEDLLMLLMPMMLND